MTSWNPNVKLDKIPYSVRAAQAVLQYGVGAMVDFSDQTLLTAAPETWQEWQRIDDERFAKALGVNFFALPTKISYSRFPEWYFCPKCRKFQPIEKWISEYKKSKPDACKSNPDMVKSACCDQDLVVARIVTVCEAGHINDFPWIQWVHRKNTESVCQNSLLYFKTSSSGTEGLEGLYISCDCGAYSTLKGAFDKGCFAKLDKDLNKKMFLCTGNHPHSNIKEECSFYPRTMQRGSSSVYFPLVYSSLVIPPYADKLNRDIEKSNNFIECEVTLKKTQPESENILKNCFEKWLEQIANEIDFPAADVRPILKRKWFDKTTDKADVGSSDYKREEYMALSGKVSAPSGMSGDFSRENIDKEEFGNQLSPHIKAVALIDKVRVVNALVGFSRINPVSRKTDKGFVDIKNKETPWYPAYEVRGEGIFIEFEQDDIDEWVSNNDMVRQRAKELDNNYKKSFIAPSYQRHVTSKFLLLHTISHLLIRQLSFECGYSIASLSERIYCIEDSVDEPIAGIFIYTASGDSEGTLGGLVRQGKPDIFPQVFRKAITEAKICSNDPVCILSNGQGRESLNLAACYACALLPETCCEERNSFLDRGLVIGTYNDPQLGFFQYT